LYTRSLNSKLRTPTGNQTGESNAKLLRGPSPQILLGIRPWEKDGGKPSTEERRTINKQSRHYYSLRSGAVSKTNSLKTKTLKTPAVQKKKRKTPYEKELLMEKGGGGNRERLALGSSIKFRRREGPGEKGERKSLAVEQSPSSFFPIFQ